LVRSGAEGGLVETGASANHGLVTRDALRIQPWAVDARYWQYKGKPVLLLGGTDQDNLFNHPNIGPHGLEAHLDLLKSVGGNYVRNTMSSRDRVDSDSHLYNDVNLYPFHRDEETGLYDLSRFDERYWELFDNFLDLTAEREIIVQIELWDRWDYGTIWRNAYAAEGWAAHPFNPANNINYSSEETNLHEENWQGYPIFRTIPELDDVPKVLAFQEAMIERLLSISLAYDHVLYCISNESNASEEWSRHWADFVRERARAADINVEVTEMWNPHDLTHAWHRRTFDHPGLYSYVDTSQNNHLNGQAHWDNMHAALRMVADPLRPMNNVKVYGGRDIGGGTTEGAHRFWRNILGGVASSRFHRPGPQPGGFGLGLNDKAQAQIRGGRMLANEFDIFRARPDIESGLLVNREPNEAYLSFISNKQYALYFPNGGSVDLNLADAEGSFTLKWLDISKGHWIEEKQMEGGRPVTIQSPGQGRWIALAARNGD
jgi:hypothetical protein